MVLSKGKTYRRKRSTRPRRSVVKNTRAIEGIKRSLKSDKNRYGLAHEARSSSFGDSVIPVMPAAVATSYSPAWSNWAQNSEIAALAGRVSVGNVRIGMAFTPYTELAPTRFTVYHIKLRPNTATTTIDALGRDLTTIGSNNEFSMRGAFSGSAGVATTNAHVTLNPTMFEIKKKWAFTLGGSLAVAPAQQISTNMRDSIYHIDYTVPMGNQVLGSPNGKWTALDADAYRNQNLNYIVVFTDQSTLDTESPSYSMIMSCVCTAKE